MVSAGGEGMDAVSIFLDLLTNFFPLLGAILLGGALVAVGLFWLFVCVMIIIGGIKSVWRCLQNLLY